MSKIKIEIDVEVNGRGLDCKNNITINGVDIEEAEFTYGDLLAMWLVVRTQKIEFEENAKKNGIDLSKAEKMLANEDKKSSIDRLINWVMGKS